MNRSAFRAFRRLLAAVLFCALFAGLVPIVHGEEELSLASEAAVLIDAETGQVLYAKNADQRMYPASITKVMTGLLALRYLNPEGTLTVSQTAVNAVPITSSHISLEPGEVLTVEQALYALAMESANDAANVLAEAVSGSLTAFAERMTEEAISLGAVNTHFTNANGLPDSDHYTTAYDMALIMAEAIKVRGFTDYFSTLKYTCAATNYNYPRYFTNRNRMLFDAYYYEGVIASKTGWTSAAQGTLVTAVKRGDTTLIAVVLKSVMTEDKYKDTWALMDYGFDRMFRTELTGEDVAAGLPLPDYVAAEDQNYHVILPLGTEKSALRYALADSTEPTDAAVQQVTVKVCLDGKQLTVIPLSLRPRPVQPKRVKALLTALDEIEELPDLPEEVSGIPIIFFEAAACGVLLLIPAFCYCRRHRTRTRQRRVLERRIRVMRKQMAQTEEKEL